MSEDRIDLAEATALVELLDIMAANAAVRIAADHHFTVRAEETTAYRAARLITSLAAEVERLRPAAPAGGAVTAARETACLDRFDGQVATMLCIADRGHAGRHDYHRIENVSIVGGEGEGHGPR